MMARLAGRPSLSPGELQWAARFALGVMLLTALPYAAAWAAERDGWRFGGFLLAVEDGNSYIAKMGQGARGAWLLKLPYSSEPQRGAFLWALHLLLGRLAGPDHDRLVLAFHLARLVLGVALLLVSYLFLAEFLPRVRQRRLGLALVALGGGLGWLLALLNRSSAWGSLPIDFISPEAYTFLVLYGLPHLAAARSLFLLGLLAYLQRRGVWAGLALLGLSFLQPLSVLVALALMGADMVLGWVLQSISPAIAESPSLPLGQALRSAQGSDFAVMLSDAKHLLGASCRPLRFPHALSAALRRGRPFASLRVTLTAALISSPGVLYVIYASRVDPVLRQWNAQNVLPSPHPAHYALGYGVLIAFGIFGWRALWRRRPDLARFLGGWVLAASFLLYLPIPPQRRVIEGFQLPLVVLAVLGLTVAFRRFRLWMTAALLALSLPTTALLLFGSLSAARTPAEPIFHPADQVAAFDWLSKNVKPGQVGLSAYETGNALPAYTPLLAYIGHGPETVFLAEKAPRVAAFYRSATSDAERRRLLAEGRIHFVIFGPHERALGDFEPRAADYLMWRFSSGEYAIYEVNP